MTGHRLLLIFRDGVVAHPGEEIVRLIVITHMIEAESPVFAFTQPPLWRAMACRGAAARPVARRAVGAHPAILAGLDTDAIEYGRVEFHRDRLCGTDAARRKALTNCARSFCHQPHRQADPA